MSLVTGKSVSDSAINTPKPMRQIKKRELTTSRCTEIPAQTLIALKTKKSSCSKSRKKVPIQEGNRKHTCLNFKNNFKSGKK